MNNLNATQSDKNVVEYLIAQALIPLGGTPDYSNPEEGYITGVKFLLPREELSNRPAVVDNAAELKEKFPHGFHILRVLDVSRYKNSPTSAYDEVVSIGIEVLAKQEGELSAEEKAEEAELKKRVKAEQELEAESLVLDSHERAVVDLIRASDESIPPYDEMKDAVKKIVRSHIKTLQDLMRL